MCREIHSKEQFLPLSTMASKIECGDFHFVEQPLPLSALASNLIAMTVAFFMFLFYNQPDLSTKRFIK